MSDQPILVTGAAGFVGFHVCRQLLAEGRGVVGLDSLNNYYDPALKQSRLDLLVADPRFVFVRADLADRAGVAALFAEYKFAAVIHLAAQAGVRYSIDHPHAYVEANLEGFLNVLEGCRHHGCRHLVYASSSSVYGANTKLPFSVSDRTDHPVSLYAATKRANELMAHSYSHLYDLPVTGLRFFTVYGPWGRPDMAIFLFTKAIVEGRPIKLFNYGRMRRDFTYIDGRHPGSIEVDRSHPRRRSGRGRGAREDLQCRQSPSGGAIARCCLLEKELGLTAKKETLPMQPGDVLETFADIEELTRDTGFRPDTSIEDGVGDFVAWYRTHYKV